MAHEGWKRISKLIRATTMAELPEEILSSEAVRDVRDLHKGLADG